jgi:hypothetical protein
VFFVDSAAPEEADERNTAEIRRFVNWITSIGEIRTDEFEIPKTWGLKSEIEEKTELVGSSFREISHTIHIKNPGIASGIFSGSRTVKEVLGVVKDEIYGTFQREVRTLWDGLKDFGPWTEMSRTTKQSTQWF